MKVLQIQLYSGSWRYVTGIIANKDIRCSIYETDAIHSTFENSNAVFDVIDKLDLYKTLNVREV